MKTPSPKDGVRGNATDGTAVGVANKMGAPMQFYSPKNMVWQDRPDYRAGTPLTSSVYYRVKPAKE